MDERAVDCASRFLDVLTNRRMAAEFLTALPTFLLSFVGLSPPAPCLQIRRFARQHCEPIGWIGNPAKPACRTDADCCGKAICCDRGDGPACYFTLFNTDLCGDTCATLQNCREVDEEMIWFRGSCGIE